MERRGGIRVRPSLHRAGAGQVAPVAQPPGTTHRVTEVAKDAIARHRRKAGSVDRRDLPGKVSDRRVAQRRGTEPLRLPVGLFVGEHVKTDVDGIGRGEGMHRAGPLSV